MEEYESFLWQFIDNSSMVEVVLPVNCSLDPDAIISWQLHFQFFFLLQKITTRGWLFPSIVRPRIDGYHSKSIYFPFPDYGLANLTIVVD